MPNPTISSNEKITEALKLLEEAAREKKNDLRDLMANKYSNLKELVSDTEYDIKESLAIAKKRASDILSKATDIGERRVKEVAAQLDDNVRANPWPYIGGVALTGLLIGYILGRK